MNCSRSPFSNIVDLKISQDFFIEAGGRKHEFQVTLDIFNFTNMINKDWGRRYRSFINGVGLITVEGVDDVEVNGRIERTPSFSYRAPSTNTSTGILSIDDIGSLSSRWQAQLGLRYTF